MIFLLHFLHLIRLKQRPFKWVNAAIGLSFQKAFVVESEEAVTVAAQSQLHQHLALSQTKSWAAASDSTHPTEAVACLFKWGKSVSELLPNLSGILMAELVQGSALPDESWFGLLLIHCQAYLQKVLKSCVNSCEESGSYLVLQMLRQETADAAPPARGFYCLQDDSLKSYSLIAVRLVAFIKRCQQDKMLQVVGQGFKDSMCCLAAEDYFDRPSIKTLHALLLSLFCPVNLTETTHDMNIHVCAFLRLASLNEHFVVDSPTRVMALTSRLKYLIRSTILIEVRRSVQCE
jgi:hypothetical protein